MADEPSFNIQNYVYEGVWKNYREPAFRRWTWTLSDSKALLSLACISIIVAFAQTRMWVIARYIIYQRTKSPRLEGSDDVDSRLTLSQGAAMAEALPSIRIALVRAIRQRRPSTTAGYDGRIDSSTDRDDPSTSPMFGVVAMVNVMIFISMGVLIPWALSNGSLETPIVKSRLTEQCLQAERVGLVGNIFRDVFQADAILQQCRGRLDSTCAKDYYLQQPKVTTRRVDACPFLGDGVCMEGEETVEITHEDITAYEVGVNSPTTITMNHRLRCAPLVLDKFYLFESREILPNSTTDYGDAPILGKPGGKRLALLGAFITVKPQGKISGYFHMRLHTLNGPHKFLNENSGFLVAERDIQSDVTVLPKALAEFANEDLLPALRLHDASPFIVVYRAGATRFLSPIDDPFFSAHNVRENDSAPYADREATALGCAEQFQFCRRSQNFCTGWGMRSSMAYRLFNASDRSSWPEDEVADVVTIFRMLPAMFSVNGYLAWHIAIPKSMTGAFPLVAPTGLWGTTSWAVQVETWFTKAMVNAILHARYGAMAPLDEDSHKFSREQKRKYAVCGRVLFPGPGYTNINWVGAWCTVGALLFICVASYTIDLIYETPRKLLWELKRFVWVVQSLLFLRSSRRGLRSLEAEWNNIGLSDLDVEDRVEPVSQGKEDNDPVVPDLESGIDIGTVSLGRDDDDGALIPDIDTANDVESVTPEHEDIDGVIPGLARASTSTSTFPVAASVLSLYSTSR